MTKEKEHGTFCLEVGRPYLPGRGTFPEGIEFGWRGAQDRPELRFFWPGLTEEEITAFNTGDIELGIYYQSPVLLLLYRIEGATDWSDLAYTPHGSPQDLLDFPDPDGCQGLGLRLVLTDADTGIVKVLRDLALSGEFSRMLLTHMQEQSEASHDPVLFNQVLDEIYTNYPEPDEIAAKALIREQVAIAH
jgi:hypothetical protein